ncbi:NAD(P)-dependent oxidoreductase [Mesorhizobium sp. M0488]|uniref:NAD(P)-dependent oxidoreductase n=1 Tax=unclassified Mesorhizobium TaxID=325217 RepID=UPI00333A6D95
MRAVFVDCTEELRRVMEQQDLPRPDHVRVNIGDPSVDDLVRLGNEADVLLVEHTVIPPQVLDACPTVRGIVFMGTGAGTYVDTDDAHRRGVTVLTTPGYGDRAVAEHALALMMAAARNVARMDRAVRSGAWRPMGGLQLERRKLAVVGLGGIGSKLAEIGLALGMNVAGWNRSPREVQHFEADLDEALRDADIVSLHVALTTQTAGLLDARRLALPKRGFILVNTARAQLIDEAGLLSGLRSGQIGHAALDVFPVEPLARDNPYADLDNVTLTAHAAYMTDDAYAELWRRTLLALETLERGWNT